MTLEVGSLMLIGGAAEFVDDRVSIVEFLGEVGEIAVGDIMVAAFVIAVAKGVLDGVPVRNIFTLNTA